MLVSARNGHEAESAQPPQVARAPAPQDRGASRNSPEVTHAAVSRPAPFQFRRAVKRDAKVRLAISGPSGSGKTYSLLRIATELGGPIALVDTERGSAQKYADLFEFDTLPLESFSPDLIPGLIETAVAKGYRALIIDSFSHFWSGIDGELDQVDKMRRRLRDNGFAAWNEVTPKHNRMIDAMLGAPLHILVGMRVKTEWVTEMDERTGKTKSRKIGLAPIMRDGIEYEFDVCGDMDPENTLQVTKSRCPNLSGELFPKPGKELVDVLKEWLGSQEASTEPLRPSIDARHTLTVPDEGGLVNSIDMPETASAISHELASIWKKMCHPRGVAKEFADLRSEVELLAGSTGLAEYCRILRQHGVENPKLFKASQPARLCARDVFRFLENLRENNSPPELDTNGADVGEPSVAEKAK